MTPSDNTIYSWEQIYDSLLRSGCQNDQINAIRQSLENDGPWCWLQLNEALKLTGWPEQQIYDFLLLLNPTKVQNVKFTNQYVTEIQKPKWVETPDGFLRCKARILAERVMPYHVSELEELPEDITSDLVNMYVPGDAMQDGEAIHSLEGAQITIGDHQWLSPDNSQEFSRGHVAGTPMIEDVNGNKYITCDLLVTHPDAIDQIKSGECPEISAAYLADTIFEPGNYGDHPYDAKQVNLRFNHIAVIPAGHGRAGQDVRILNKKKGEQAMAEENKLFRVQLKNTGKFINTDEEGAGAIEEEKSMSSAGLDKAMSELEEKNAELESVKSEVEDLKGQLSVYKEKLDALLAEETIEHAAAGMLEEAGEAGEIIENMVDEEKKEEIKNSLKGKFGNSLHAAVLAAVGVNTEGMSSDAIRGAFKAQAQISNAMKGRVTPVKVAGHNMALQNTNKAAVEVPVMNSRQRLGLEPRNKQLTHSFRI